MFKFSIILLSVFFFASIDAGGACSTGRGARVGVVEQHTHEEQRSGVIEEEDADDIPVPAETFEEALQELTLLETLKQAVTENNIERVKLCFNRLDSLKGDQLVLGVRSGGSVSKRRKRFGRDRRGGSVSKRLRERFRRDLGDEIGSVYCRSFLKVDDPVNMRINEQGDTILHHFLDVSSNEMKWKELLGFFLKRNRDVFRKNNAGISALKKAITSEMVWAACDVLDSVDPSDERLVKIYVALKKYEGHSKNFDYLIVELTNRTAFQASESQSDESCVTTVEDGEDAFAI